MQVISSTAGWTAVGRMLETAREDRFLDDPLAERMCTTAERRQWEETVVTPLGFSPPLIPVRARLGDEVVRWAVSAGYRQVVSLAAGLESRALRLDLPADLTYLELDLPELLEARGERLGATSPAGCVRIAVPADLSGDWVTPLCGAGFARGARTLWLTEGLLPYLGEAACRTLLETIAGLSAPDSRLWCDHIHPDVFTSADYEVVLKNLDALGVSWRSAWTDPAGELAACGWDARAWTLAELIDPGSATHPPASWMPPVPARAGTFDAAFHWLVWARLTPPDTGIPGAPTDRGKANGRETVGTAPKDHARIPSPADGTPLAERLSAADRAALADDIREGLAGTPRRLPTKWLYDTRGSELFEAITRLPEYYLTRAERGILARRAADIAAHTRAHDLVELGSGSSEKTRLLIDALRAEGTLRRYVPVDASAGALRQAVHSLAADYPGLPVEAVTGDFTAPLDLGRAGGPALLALLGGTLGNLMRDERHHLLATTRAQVRTGDALLLGVDLIKDERTLVAAYDDHAGVTARFAKNGLLVLNRELDATFDPSAFDHVAVWDARAERVENALRARWRTEVTLGRIGLTVVFEPGERLRVGVSHKFREEGLRRELAAAGFRLARWWTDDAGHYALGLAHPM